MGLGLCLLICGLGSLVCIWVRGLGSWVCVYGWVCSLWLFMDLWVGCIYGLWDEFFMGFGLCLQDFEFMSWIFEFAFINLRASSWVCIYGLYKWGICLWDWVNGFMGLDFEFTFIDLWVRGFYGL
jgi:hypothetical protein